ncbi:NmrA family NAD(P)-binding protein [Nonomuraea endophytica]|uniref:NmrA family NAD(P)-binding protein n=1 Tax=Nonomuraea endophytica TaxID=714136 RepID=UPI0037C8C109
MNELNPILVVGGTGTTGRRVVSLLRGRGVAVRVGSRSGEPRFDWSDRATWDAALAGVRAVYVVPLDGELLTRPFVERAVELGVRRIVLLSGRGVDVPGYGDVTSGVGATHAEGEKAVLASGAEWTIVRPGWFAQNFSEGFFHEAVATGELRLPAGDGAVSFVDAADIAAVVAAALTGDGHAGQVYELSGPRALTMAEAAAAYSSATGRPLSYVDVDPEAFVAELVKEGWPVADAEGYAAAVAPARLGMDAYLSDGVQRALGRPPTDFADIAWT